MHLLSRSSKKTLRNEIVNRLRVFRARYRSRALNQSPLAVYARLHVVAPVSLLAIVVFATVGIALPQGRQQEDAATLIEESRIAQAYERLSNRNWGSEVKRRGKEIRAAHIDRLLALARASGLRNCRWDPILRFTESGLECDGREPSDGTLEEWFWLALILSFICLLSWVFLQLRDSWMLPDWNPRLWYTPIYASVVGLIMCGPFVMTATYLWRARSDYPVPPAESLPIAPGAPLYLLAVLQITSVVIASVERRPPAQHFAIGAIGVVAVGFILYLLLAVGSFGGTPRLLMLVFLEILVAALLMLRRKFAPEQTPGFWVDRVFELSRVLLVAWGLLVGRAALNELGVRSAPVDFALTAAVFAVILLHFMNSQRSELSWSGP